MTKSLVWIFIAAYNEEATIGAVIDDCLGVTSAIVVVDDCSTDTTVDIAHRKGVVVLCHCINRGKGAAIRTGTAYALSQGADIIVHFDADGQHHAFDIPRLIQPILGGRVDVVLGSRFLNGASTNISPARRAVLRLGSYFTWFFSGIRLSDAHNGLIAFSRTAARTIVFTEDRMAYASELIDEIRRLKIRYCEEPVTITYTDYSRGKGQRSSNALAIGWKMIWKKLFLG
ncbi:glycosyltransferase family 2 protein [Candidatus Uhrbacteria bacterium]|nr:glycosyltransferase family 2 protein [Candidatus Uhrbacteria bacterium]